MALTIQGLYRRTVGTVLPGRVRTRNGVAVPADSLFDRDDADYKAGLVDPLRPLVRPDDRVVVAGDACRVASVVAARAATGGRVSVFTPTPGAAERCRAAHDLNGTTGRVSVEHALVGTPERVHGPANDGRVLGATELPTCDVLVLDCEGAETALVWGLEQVPRVIVVEVHGHYGADRPVIEAVLDDREYAVACREDVGSHPEHVVLVAEQDGSRWRGPFEPGWD